MGMMDCFACISLKQIRMFRSQPILNLPVQLLCDLNHFCALKIRNDTTSVIRSNIAFLPEVK